MKRLLFLVMGIIILAGCQNNEGYEIDGTIKGAEDGMVYLKSLENGKPVTVDSVKITNESFEFSGKVEQPLFYLAYYNETRMPIVFFIENENITIKANIDSLDKAEITGSPETDLFLSFNKEMPFMNRSMKMREEYMQAQMAGDNAKMESLTKEMETIMDAQQKYFTEFVKTNTTSVVGAFLASQMAQSLSLEELKELVSSYEAGLGEHPYVELMKTTLKSMEELNKLNASTGIGSEAPDFTLLTKDGKEVKLSSFRGKFVLIDFWASWCQPCRRENPNSVKVYNQYNSKGFEILGVSLDKDRDAWIKAVKDDGLAWAQVIDTDGNVANKYNVNSIPSTFLLDKDGKIVAKNLRGDALNKQMEKLLSK
jgi:peroxiredoxin